MTIDNRDPQEIGLEIRRLMRATGAGVLDCADAALRPGHERLPLTTRELPQGNGRPERQRPLRDDDPAV